MKKASEIIQRLPHWLEFLIVITICFGVFTGSSIYRFASGAAFGKFELTNDRMIGLLLMEIIFSAICISFLMLRGYNLRERIPFSPSLNGTLLGIGLLFLALMGYVVLFAIVVAVVGQENLRIGQFSSRINVFLITLVSLVNPLFEETFVVGYIFDKLQKQSFWVIIILSVAIRVSYHLYQGWIGIISLLPVGIIFALAYYRTKNLWPIYLAHMMADMLGLLSSNNT